MKVFPRTSLLQSSGHTSMAGFSLAMLDFLAPMLAFNLPYKDFGGGEPKLLFEFWVGLLLRGSSSAPWVFEPAFLLARPPADKLIKSQEAVEACASSSPSSSKCVCPSIHGISDSCTSVFFFNWHCAQSCNPSAFFFVWISGHYMAACMLCTRPSALPFRLCVATSAVLL